VNDYCQKRTVEIKAMCLEWIMTVTMENCQKGKVFEIDKRTLLGM
jgi:hypothetical protein